MLPAQLKETTMMPGSRTLLQVEIPEEESKATAKTVKDLMGNKPELRFKFIQENAAFAGEDMLDIDGLYIPAKTSIFRAMKTGQAVVA